MLYSRTSESQIVSMTWRRPYRPISSSENRDIAPSSFKLPRKPNARSSTRTARGTPVQLQGPKKPLHASLHIRTGLYKSDPMRLLREASGELKGNYHMVDPAKVWRTPKTCEKHGGARRPRAEQRNSWIRNRTFRANSHVIARVPVKKSVRKRATLLKK